MASLKKTLLLMVNLMCFPMMLLAQSASLGLNVSGRANFADAPGSPNLFDLPQGLTGEYMYESASRFFYSIGLGYGRKGNFIKNAPHPLLVQQQTGQQHDR